MQGSAGQGRARQGGAEHGPISWRCLAQNSVLTTPSKARISMGLGRIYKAQNSMVNSDMKFGPEQSTATQGRSSKAGKSIGQGEQGRTSGQNIAGQNSAEQ